MSQQVAQTTFTGTDEIPELGYAGQFDESIESENDLGDYLSRPVEIHRFGFATSDYTGINPWMELFNTSAYFQKLNGFKYFRGTLCIRVAISISPFAQGCAFIAYNPGGYGNRDNICSSSQLPHLVVDPNLTNDQVLRIPFHFPVQYLDWYGWRAGNVMPFPNPKLYNAVVTPLINSQTLTAVNTDIVVYAWFEDVELRVSTTVKAQGNEYDERAPISSVSRVVATAAHGLSGVPVIGPFMTATAWAADSISAVASAFGFTKVPIVTGPHFAKISQGNQLAITSGQNATGLLTLSDKAERTIGPRCVTGNDEDQMAFNYMARQWSYLTLHDWTTSHSYGHACMNVAVTPHVRSSLSGPGGGFLYLPCTIPALLHTYWRGSMEYKFYAIKTPYHQGKLLIRWLPEIGITMDASNVGNTFEGYSVVWDIAQDSEITVTVPYAANTPWKTSVRTVPAASLTDTTYNRERLNGTIYLNVMSPLTGPAASSAIKIMVLARAGPDMEWSCPTSQNHRRLFYENMDTATDLVWTETDNQATTNSGNFMPIYPQGMDDDSILLGPASSNPTAAADCSGETSVSLRDLVKRSELDMVVQVFYVDNEMLTPFVPTLPYKKGRVYGTNEWAPEVRPTVINFATPLFYATRGSTQIDMTMRQTYELPVGANAYNSDDAWSCAFTRSFAPGYSFFRWIHGTFNEYDQGATNGLSVQKSEFGYISVKLPHYSKLVTQPVDTLYYGHTVPVGGTTNYVANGVFFEPLRCLKANNQRCIQMYRSAGLDFTLDWFLGCPELFETNMGYFPWSPDYWDSFLLNKEQTMEVIDRTSETVVNKSDLEVGFPKSSRSLEEIEGEDLEQEDLPPARGNRVLLRHGVRR